MRHCSQELAQLPGTVFSVFLYSLPAAESLHTPALAISGYERLAIFLNAIIALFWRSVRSLTRLGSLKGIVVPYSLMMLQVLRC